MSTAPENEFDLEKLFLPAWAQEPSAEKYSKYEGEQISDRRDDRRGPRGPRRDRPREGRRDDRGPRPQHGQDRPQRGDRRSGPPGPGYQPRGEGERPPFRRGERREAPPPLPEVDIALLPDEKGVESL